MLRGRAGGGGAAFNLGEASVVRATVKLGTGEVGHAVVLGRDTVRARMAAHLDALWQRPDWRARVEADVVAPGLAAEVAAATSRAEETEATRVDFFTLVRGED
jgi:alpha-D-ribose 1-methylphosphonate 5-triphosphate synthase subunit PhnG